MVEHEGALNQSYGGSDEGVLIGLNTHESLLNSRFESPDIWQPTLPDGDFLRASLVGSYGGFGGIHNDLHSITPPLPSIFTAEKYGFAVFPKHYGSPNKIIGCYRAVDRLALLAFVKRVDGISIPNADVLFKGNIYKEVGRTNEHGIVGAYLLPDSYNDTIIISPNGIVYRQVELKEIGNGVYQITVQRKTKANATFRQIHRMFD